MHRSLIFVAKRPVPGQVKTRIAATLGAERATELYRAALEDTVDLVSRFDAEPVISYAPNDNEAREFFGKLAPGFVLVPQQGDNFGQRLLSAFQQVVARGAQQMVLIGTDNPSLPRAHIEQAFRALDNPDVDAVLGQVSDGGYYLIGMRTLYPILFERIDWSTEVVAQQSHQRAIEGGIRLVDVAPWYDLDTADDLVKLYNEVAASDDNRAPRTRALIERFGLVSNVAS